MQMGKPIIIHKLLNCCLASADTLNFCTKTQLECVILGHTGILKHEITKIPFACSSLSSDFKKGTLQDVLRVRKFMSKGEAYRS